MMGQQVALVRNVADISRTIPWGGKAATTDSQLINLWPLHPFVSDKIFTLHWDPDDN